MKYLLILITLVSAEVFGCFAHYDVTTNNIENLPVIIFVDNNEVMANIGKQTDHISFRLYLRDTANLEGLNTVHMSMVDEDGEISFSGDLSIFHYEKRNQKMVNFIVKRDQISSVTLTVSANSSTENKQGEPIHSCRFSYSAPLSLLYEHFKQNTFVTIVVDSDQTEEMERFEKREFIEDREIQLFEAPRPVAKPPKVPQQPATTAIVYPGETLDDVARRVGVSPAELRATNRISGEETIYPGMKLKIPNGKVSK